jgi:hypothetical protein
MRLLPDPSPGPFDLKTEIHLQMMGLDYRKLCKGRANAPKAKLPYIGLPLISVPKVPVGFLGNSSGCSEFL